MIGRIFHQIIANELLKVYLRNLKVTSKAKEIGGVLRNFSSHAVRHLGEPEDSAVA